MNKTFVSLILVLVLLIAGCTLNMGGTTNTSENAISNNDQATDTMMNVSSGVDEVGSTLDDIDTLLG